MALLSSLSNFKNTGILLVRIGLGIMFIMHGYPKLFGGPKLWEGIGGAMGEVGVTFFPMAWGLLAALTETLGGFCFLLGLFFRPIALVMAFNMLIASLHHIGAGEGFNGASHAIEMGIVFLGFVFIGPGKYSVDKR